MRLLKYINEDSVIEKLTNWQINKYFHNLSEIFNSSIKIKKEIGKDLLSTTFVVGNVEYVFMARIEKDEANILFHPLDLEDDIFLQRNNSKSFLGTLFASVFMSIDIMLKEYEINTILFSTENKKLESIYKRMNKWILKRFPDWKLNNKTGNKFKYIRK